MTNYVGILFMRVVLVFITMFTIISVILNTINLFLKVKPYFIVCLVFTGFTVLISLLFIDFFLDFGKWERLIPPILVIISILLLVAKFILNKIQSGKKSQA